MLLVTCPECDNTNRHREGSAGCIVRCAGCGTKYRCPVPTTPGPGFSRQRSQVAVVFSALFGLGVLGVAGFIVHSLADHIPTASQASVNNPTPTPATTPTDPTYLLLTPKPPNNVPKHEAHSLPTRLRRLTAFGLVEDSEPEEEYTPTQKFTASIPEPEPEPEAQTEPPTPTPEEGSQGKPLQTGESYPSAPRPQTQTQTQPNFMTGPSSSKPVHVNGYTRKDGTHVQPHTRSAPGTAPSRGGGRR
jgi:hypothetical protein